MKYKRNKSSKYKTITENRNRRKNVLHKIPSYVIIITLILFCILKISEKGYIPLSKAFKDTRAEKVFEKVQSFSEKCEGYISYVGEKGANFISGYLKSDKPEKESEKVFAKVPNQELPDEVPSDASQAVTSETDVFSPSLPCTGRISSPFGKREHPISGQSGFHNGVDIAVDAGTPIKAIEDGIVEKSIYDQYSGNLVVISHMEGYKSSYAHLGESKVSEGQRVKKGDVIGVAGSTGISTGPHLHMEIKKDGELIDPLELIEE